jgi:rifampin ADP-ribosylating transferase
VPPPKKLIVQSKTEARETKEGEVLYAVLVAANVREPRHAVAAPDSARFPGMQTVNPRPFVVSHPCPVCEGHGKTDAVCSVCRGTGVARFFHGTKADLKAGDLIEPGRAANFGELGRAANHVYFAGTLDAATWGAELARGEARGRIYIVQPIGPFEDDPNLTNKKFPGNPTKSYRSRESLRVTGEVASWQGHSNEQLEAMKAGLAKLKREGTEHIDD